MISTARTEPAERQPYDALKAIYCQNKKCPNGRPIGRMAPGAGCAEFACKVCGVRRTVFGAEIARGQ
jgi:hypothetical protein